MNLTVTRRAADYLYKLCVKCSTTPEQIEYYPQKTESMWGKKPQAMPRAVSPESMGISSAYVEEFLHALEKDRHSNMHNLLIYRSGKLISAASAPGYSPLVWSLTHSMAKTVTSFAVAMLLSDGVLSLDTPLAGIFADELPPVVSPRMRRITVRHLLTMTAGVTDVGETASVTVKDWKRAFLSSLPASAPGKRFFYNSMNSYMLSAAVEKLSGESLEEFLEKRLFAPLGIRDVFIEKSPEGIAKGGWGMYLSPVDMAKLGQLVLQDGVWEGKQILPAGYVREATLPHVRTEEGYGDYNYGYHLWVARDDSAVLFNGMLGQNVWICPRTEMVIVSTAGNDEFFQLSTTLRLIAKYFGKSFSPAPTPLLPNLISLSHLRRAEQNFFCARMQLPLRGRHEDCYSRRRECPLPDRAYEIAGVYEAEKNNVGLLPLVFRAMQNNHSPGISRIGFSCDDKRFLVSVTEGETERVLECGFGTYRWGELEYKGEKFLAGACAAFMQNEDGEELLRIDLAFPELPNSRRLKFYFHEGNRVVVSLSEAPGTDMIDAVLGSLSANAAVSPYLIDIVRRHLSDGQMLIRLLHCMEPILYATAQTEGTTQEQLPGKEKALAVRRRLSGAKIRR